MSGVMDHPFVTTKNVPFLCYVETAKNRMSLVVETYHISGVNLEWELVLTESSQKHDALVLETVAIKLGNTVARLTRRAAGNIYFVPTMDDQVRLQKFFERTGPSGIQILVQEDMPANEIRCTYWRRCSDSNTGETLAVDGGIQITPEGAIFQPSWRKYFVAARFE